MCRRDVLHYGANILKSCPLPVFSSHYEDMEAAGKEMAQRLHAIQAAIDFVQPVLADSIRWLDSTFAGNIAM